MKSLISSLHFISFAQSTPFLSDPFTSLGFDMHFKYTDSDYYTDLFIGTPAQDFSNIKFSTDVNSILVGEKQQGDQGVGSYFNSRDSSTAVTVKGSFDQQIDAGYFKALLYKDTVCLETKTNCMDGFTFMTASGVS